MVEGTWFWSHGFKALEPDQAPRPFRYTLSQLEAMSWEDQIKSFLSRWNVTAEGEEKPIERMAFILEHGIKFHSHVEHLSREMATFYYVSVLLPPRRAVEFTLRWDFWMEDESPVPS